MGDTSYSYDINGNMLSKTTSETITDFQYNVANRLTKISNNGTEASYYYDPFGRRIAKEVNGERTWFHYSAEGLVAEFDAEGRLTTSYSYEPDSFWSTNPLLMSQAGNHYFYHNDHLGAPHKLTDFGGKVVWQASYDAFGEVTIEKELVSNNFRFPGQYFDAETGLYYNWHRFYDPENWRYITAAPIELAGGMNLYAYADGDPIKSIDPLGIEIRVYSSDAFSISGLNHAFVYFTETGRTKGTDGSSWVTRGDGSGDLDSLYKVAPLPPATATATSKTV